MKLICSILALGFLLLSLGSAAQSNDIQHPNPITKGYYGIGNNASRLNKPNRVKPTSTKSYASVQKGYYSIGDNYKKLGPQIVIEGSNVPTTPVAPKGYYSIERKTPKF